MEPRNEPNNFAMGRKPRLGIIIATDWSKGLPFGGDVGFLQNILPEIHLKSTVFGIALQNHAKVSQAALPSGVQIVPLFAAKYPSPMPFRLKSLLGYWRNRSRILNSDVDVLYVHSWETVLPFLFGKRRLPVVFHQHGSPNPLTYCRFGWARTFVFRWFFDVALRVAHKRADWIIAVDRLCVRQARDHGAEGKTTLLLNAVGTTEFYPDAEARRAKRRELGLDDSEPVALFAGRLEVGHKRVHDALHAASLLSATGHRFRLLVAGDGPSRQALERLGRELGLGDRLMFLGYVPHKNLPALYNAADALLLPSDIEGTPMVILEALACGTPVVARAVGGIPDLVHSGENGILYEKAGAANLASAVEDCLSARWSRPQIAASIAEWDTGNVARRLEHIFQHVLAGRA